MDQLDALRWTQANSSEAIQICIELINQVNYINRDRKHKMIMVLVCREYDLKNDNNIKLLFQSRQDETEEQKEQWKKISIKNFDDALVKEIIGEKYDSLITRTREILRIPGNLYIWQHLSEGENYNDCTTTSNLMDKWYRQICERSSTVGVEERTVIETLDVIVDKLDNPNIAIACDAEQIICCKMDKNTHKITYLSGAIEDQEIKQNVVDVLEGTMPAFDLRRRKYV